MHGIGVAHLTSPLGRSCVNRFCRGDTQCDAGVALEPEAKDNCTADKLGGKLFMGRTAGSNVW